jgi:glycosyltransferase involved in cell wall biosynthesis
MTLSVLVCSLPERTRLLFELLTVLNPQLEDEEIIINIDKRKTIGAKRNDLLNAARGDYVCFIDDDDMISEDYLAEIRKGLELKPDQVAISGVFYHAKEHSKTRFTSSKDYEWGLVDGEYRRNVLHLNPVKRELAIKVGFPDISYGEDRKYGKDLRPLIKTEYRILKEIYFYNYTK